MNCVLHARIVFPENEDEENGEHMEDKQFPGNDGGENGNDLAEAYCKIIRIARKSNQHADGAD
jgi:hypothetical protein